MTGGGLTGFFLRIGSLLNSPTNISMVGGNAVPAAQGAAVEAHEGHHGQGGETTGHPDLLPQVEHPDAPLLADGQHHDDPADHRHVGDDDWHHEHDPDDDWHHHG